MKREKRRVKRIGKNRFGGFLNYPMEIYSTHLTKGGRIYIIISANGSIAQLVRVLA